MKLKIIALTCLMCLALASGCSKEPHYTVDFTPNPAEVDIIITTEDALYETVDGWADRLAEMAASTTSAYDSWVAEETSKEEFFEEIGQINSKMQLLKKESDLKTEYEIEGSDSDQLRWQNLMLAYTNAKNDLNDFLVLSQELTSDEEIKGMYQSRVVENFPGDLELIKDYVASYSE